MPAPEVPFSDLQLHSKETLAKLRVSSSRSLLLRRRDAEDLVLTTASRADQDDLVMSATTRMFVALMQRDDTARALGVDVLPEAFPWVKFLPREDVQEFVVDLVATLRAAESVNNPAPVALVIESWRHTAEVYADPELAAALADDTVDDFGPVAEPLVQA